VPDAEGSAEGGRRSGGWPWDEATPELPDADADDQPWPRISHRDAVVQIPGEFLEEAIRSVLLQGVSRTSEYMVVDRGQPRRSVEIIEKYGDG